MAIHARENDVPLRLQIARKFQLQLAGATRATTLTTGAFAFAARRGVECLFARAAGQHAESDSAGNEDSQNEEEQQERTQR
jgi:hypothetical protein